MSPSEFYTVFADFVCMVPCVESPICMAGEDVYGQWNCASFGYGESVFDRSK